MSKLKEATTHFIPGQKNYILPQSLTGIEEVYINDYKIPIENFTIELILDINEIAQKAIETQNKFETIKMKFKPKKGDRDDL